MHGKLSSPSAHTEGDEELLELNWLARILVKEGESEGNGIRILRADANVILYEAVHSVKTAHASASSQSLPLR